MERWQLAVSLMVTVGGMFGAAHSMSESARERAVEDAKRQRASDMQILSDQLNPKLDELLSILREMPKTVEQHQEQHIDVPPLTAKDAAEIEAHDKRVRDVMSRMLSEKTDAVQ